MHSTLQNKKGVDFMKKNFMTGLAHRLLLFASFEEMESVLEDYSGFMGESESKESPKEIIDSLGVNKIKGCISVAAYIIFLVASFFIFDSIRCRYGMPIIFGGILLLFSLAFLVGTYLLWGKKASLVSKYCDLKRADSFGAAILSLIPTVLIVAFPFFIIFSLYGGIPYSTQMLAANIIDVSFLVMLICGIADVVLFFDKGSKYFLPLIINYIAYACFVEIEHILCSVALVEWKFALSVSLVLAEFIVFLIATLILNKKLGGIRK